MLLTFDKETSKYKTLKCYPVLTFNMCKSWIWLLKPPNVLSFRYRHILVTKMNKTAVRWAFQTPSATKLTRKAHSIHSPLKASLAQTSSWWFTSRASWSRPEAPFKLGRRICHEKYSGVAYSKIWWEIYIWFHCSKNHLMTSNQSKAFICMVLKLNKKTGKKAWAKH